MRLSAGGLQMDIRVEPGGRVGRGPAVHHSTEVPAFHHRPVMVDEVVDLFAPVPAGLWVDATVGGGGHARAVLESRSDLRLLGLDRDRDALTAAATNLADLGDRVILRRCRFDGLRSALDELDEAEVAGVLFDLGVSSPQLDRAERGFSYRAEGPLDMRMDQRDVRTAAEVVNTYAEADLARVLRTFGDERFARRIAAAIVAARPVATTGELAEIVRDAIPAAARRTGGHPATRTFQAIRIEVNEELDVLAPSLEQAIEVLAEGGRCGVLTYHSGEDRIVVNVFRHAAGEDQEIPAGFPVEPAASRVRHVSRRARRPSSDEVQANPRAASARLRAVEHVTSTTSPSDAARVDVR